MTIQTIAKYLWREIHRGNLLVIAGIIASWFLVIEPVYKEIRDWLRGHDEATAYIVQDMNDLREELAELKESTRKELTGRKSGTVGVTRH